MRDQPGAVLRLLVAPEPKAIAHLGVIVGKRPPTRRSADRWPSQFLVPSVSEHVANIPTFAFTQGLDVRAEHAVVPDEELHNAQRGAGPSLRVAPGTSRGTRRDRAQA